MHILINASPLLLYIFINKCKRCCLNQKTCYQGNSNYLLPLQEFKIHDNSEYIKSIYCKVSSIHHNKE